MMKKIYVLSFCTLLISSCATINMFTKFDRTPRLYSENYTATNVLAPLSEIHLTPWVVYATKKSDAYKNPGGKLKSGEISFLDPMLVIDSKGNYLELIKYNADNIKDNKFVEKKSAEYLGWVHKSNLLLTSKGQTETVSQQVKRYIVAISDSSALFQPDKYIVNIKSAKVFSDPMLTEQSSEVGLNQIVYILKTDLLSNSVLISKVDNISPDKAKEQIAGWVSHDLVHEIGGRLFSTIDTIKSSEMGVLKYSPMVDYHRQDSVHSFKSGRMIPIIDKSYNTIYNVNGEAISYNRSLGIKDSLSHINIIFAFESSQMLSKQYPMLLNSIHNLRPIFIKDNQIKCSYGASVVTVDGLVTTPLTSDFDSFTNGLMSITSQQLIHKDKTPWIALNGALQLADVSRVNIIVNIGEIGGDSEKAPEEIARLLAIKNCRLLGWQLYSLEDESYNNYVLQITDMINSYAHYQSISKRKWIMYADQVKVGNLFVENSFNNYSLNYPEASMNQGVFVFPDKGMELPVERFGSEVDSLFQLVKADNNMLMASIDRAFLTVGSSKDRYNKELINRYQLDTLSKPCNKLYELIASQEAHIYMPLDTIIIADTLKDVRFLLSIKEVDAIKLFLGSLKEKEVDIIDKSNKKRGKVVTHKRYVNDIVRYNQANKGDSTSESKQPIDTVYASTKVIRKHLYITYISSLKESKAVYLSKRKLKKLTLSEIHLLLFNMPSNSKFLDNITLKSLRKRRRLTDRELSELILYFKESSDKFEQKHAEEQIKSFDDKYYYINPKLLP